MTNIATNYLKLGNNVLYIALEELENRMLMRFEQSILGVPKEQIAPNGMLDIDFFNKLQDVYESKRDVFGNLFFTRFSPNTITISKIEQLISDTTIRQGVDVDVVIIDYPDLLRIQNPTGDTSEDGGRLFEEVRRVAQDYDVVMWTASQMNRTSYGAQVVSGANIEGAHKKKNAVEMLLAVNQTPEEFESGYIRLFVDKLRNSSGFYDKMIGFRVIGDSMTVRDYGDEHEEREHNLLLESTEEPLFKDTERNKQKGSKTQAPDFASQINQNLQDKRA